LASTVGVQIARDASAACDVRIVIVVIIVVVIIVVVIIVVIVVIVVIVIIVKYNWLLCVHQLAAA
jgi:hypothetical protein